MVRNREQAARAAEATHHNKVGACQAVTRGYFLADAAGDFDGDGESDAEDGWKKEPLSARHSDRNPPRGVPVSFLGGRLDEGHRAISVGGPAPIRSTDFDGSTRRYHAGVVGNGTIDEVADAMNVTWAGWSTTIDGEPIPPPPAPAPTRVTQFHKGGPQWNVALLDDAVKNGRVGIVKRVRDGIDAQVRKLPKDKTTTRITQVVTSYKKDRVLRMGLLNAAIRDGRTGTVRDVRDTIRHLISMLPDN